MPSPNSPFAGTGLGGGCHLFSLFRYLFVLLVSLDGVLVVPVIASDSRNSFLRFAIIVLVLLFGLGSECCIFSANPGGFSLGKILLSKCSN